MLGLPPPMLHRERERERRREKERERERERDLKTFQRAHGALVGTRRPARGRAARGPGTGDAARRDADLGGKEFGVQRLGDLGRLHQADFPLVFIVLLVAVDVGAVLPVLAVVVPSLLAPVLADCRGSAHVSERVGGRQAGTGGARRARRARAARDLPCRRARSRCRRRRAQARLRWSRSRPHRPRPPRPPHRPRCLRRPPRALSPPRQPAARHRGVGSGG